MGLTDVMTRGVQTAGPSTTASVLAATMADKGVGSVVVVKGGGPIGIVTDRDLAVRVLGEGRDPDETTAGEVMSTDVVTVDADADVLSATARMRQHSVRRLPVVDDGAGMVGIVTMDDLTRLLGAELGDMVEVVEAETGLQ